MDPLATNLAYQPVLWVGAPAVLVLGLIAWRNRSRDRRRDERRGGEPVPAWLLDAAGEVIGRALVLDRSGRGLRLAVDEPRRVGSVLRIWPLDPPPEVPPVEAEVRWCRRGGHRTEVGCRFVTVPAPAVLQLFG